MGGGKPLPYMFATDKTDTHAAGVFVALAFKVLIFYLS